MKRFASIFFAALVVDTAAFAQTDTHQHSQMATNDHDRMFADTMTKHHQDGVRMAQMAADKAQNAELRSMAQKMIVDQRREIEQLQSLRGDGPMTPMREMMQMPGMMPESEMKRDMARLENASGRAFDVAFTELMPKHHEGAIRMSQHELQMGSSSGLKDLARSIAEKQTRERQELLAMHEDMSREVTSSATGRQRMAKD